MGKNNLNFLFMRNEFHMLMFLATLMLPKMLPNENGNYDLNLTVNIYLNIFFFIIKLFLFSLNHRELDLKPQNLQ